MRQLICGRRNNEDKEFSTYDTDYHNAVFIEKDENATGISIRTAWEKFAQSLQQRAVRITA